MDYLLVKQSSKESKGIMSNYKKNLVICGMWKKAKEQVL